MGDFEDLIEIASGAYGKLYKARQPKLDRDVALKVVDVSIEGAPDALAHARAMAKVEHENIVKIYAIEQFDLLGDGEVHDVIIMQWLPGETLEDRLGGDRFTSEDAIAVCRGVLNGLIALHNGNVAHGDLHCRNIMLVNGNHPVIIDVHPTEQAFLSQQSLTTREAKVSQDIGFCRTVVVRTLRHSLVSAVTTAHFDTNLVRAATLEEIKEVVEGFSNGNNSGTLDPQLGGGGLYEKCLPLIEDQKRASLQMALTDETRSLCQKLTSDDFATSTSWDDEIAKKRIESYLGLVADLVPALAACCMFGGKQEARLAGECIQSVANTYEDVDRPRVSNSGFSTLKYYPALVLYYGALLGASMARDYENLSVLLFEFKHKELERNRGLAGKLLEQKFEMDGIWNRLFAPKHQKMYRPVSDDLAPKLHPLLNPLTPKTYVDFVDEFDRLEYFSGLVLATGPNSQTAPHACVGSFLWRLTPLRGGIDRLNVGEELLTESKARLVQKSDWDGFKAGFFRGRKEDLIEAIKKFEEIVESERGRLHVR